MISVPCHPTPLSAMFLLPVAGTPRGVFALPGASSSHRIPERNLPLKRHEAGRATDTRSVHRLNAAEASRESPASGASDVAGARKPPRRGRSPARDGGKVNDATFAAGSDLKAISLNALAPLLIPLTRAWREPGEGSTVLSRFARILKRALDFHGETQLLHSRNHESQPFAKLVPGSRICRHGVLRLTNPSLQEQPA